ncbi:MAG: hypothetical protein MSB12_04555 [Lentisphaeraceae bacterium]|nr:hypothetical protein [Lentisphaeraceae bacterium]
MTTWPRLIRRGTRPVGDDIAPRYARTFDFSPASRRGQAIVESLLVLIVLVAGFCFFFDFAYGAVARLLLTNGAARAARAATVGFNDFQQVKALRVGVIPVAGKQLVPEDQRARGFDELSYVRAYLQCETEADARGMLDYTRWHQLQVRTQRTGSEVEVSAAMGVPRLMPWRLGQLVGLVPMGSEATLRSSWAIEDHAEHYLEQ